VQLAGADPELTSRRLVDYRIDVTQYQRISWHRLAAELEQHPGRFADRLVLVGAIFAGSGDRFDRLPRPGWGSQRLAGVELQCLIADSLISEHGLAPLSLPCIITFAAICSFALSWLLLGIETASHWLLVLLVGAGTLVMPIGLLRSHGLDATSVAPLAAVGMAAVAAALARYRLRDERG
jgi:CHASE2 domain-containing sensor protein